MISLIAFDSDEKFEGEGIPTLAEIEGVLRGHFRDIIEVAADDERQNLELQIGPEKARIAPRRPALPWGMLERPCKNAWYWPEAIDVMRRHTWHMVVVLHESQGDSVTKAMLLTKLTAILGEAFGYVGVYWDSATMVHDAKEFSKTADEMTVDALPLRMWVSFRTVENADDGTYTHFTRGLDAFDKMEIEIPRSQTSPEQLERWSYNTAFYMIESDKALEDGDTIGPDQDTKITVRHVPSMFDSTRSALFLDL